jgi:hypothetical protein
MFFVILESFSERRGGHAAAAAAATPGEAADEGSGSG